MREGGFYGWLGTTLTHTKTPRQKGARSDLKDKVLMPDVLIQPALGLAR